MASLPFELKGKTVYVAGHRGMVGSALVRRLAAENVELLTAARSEADLRDQAADNRWFAASRPQVVLLAGGQGRRHQDITIAEFARVVAATVGYTGQISFDTSRPDGTPRKLLDVGRRLAKLGWRTATSLEDGIRLAYESYLGETRGR
jgi:nucleoside-diphosphate-sugar epimerase